MPSHPTPEAINRWVSFFPLLCVLQAPCGRSLLPFSYGSRARPFSDASWADMFWPFALPPFGKPSVNAGTGKQPRSGLRRTPPQAHPTKSILMYYSAFHPKMSIWILKMEMIFLLKNRIFHHWIFNTLCKTLWNTTKYLYYISNLNKNISNYCYIIHISVENRPYRSISFAQNSLWHFSKFFYQRLLRYENEDGIIYKSGKTGASIKTSGYDWFWDVF